MIEIKDLQKAIEKVEKRKKNTEKAKREFLEILQKLNEKIKTDDDLIGYKTNKTFTFKFWKFNQYDFRYFEYEINAQLSFYEGEIAFYYNFTGSYYKLKCFKVKDIIYVRFDEFIEVLKEFINNISENLKTWDNEAEKLEKIKEVLS